MTFIKYQHYNLRLTSYALIDKINMIIDDFAADGFKPTLRSIYYQLVSANIIPNKEQSYDNLSVLIKKGRLMGLISWDAIEDRMRSINEWHINHSQSEALRGIEMKLAYDLWEPQGFYGEVWVEKDAQISPIAKACRDFRLPYMPCRGYMSTTEIYNSGNRFKDADDMGMRTLMIHVGDRDPSGQDMTRDNTERLALIAGYEVPVLRVALNQDQIDQYNLTPQWAKVSDKRWGAYVAEYGEYSYELDALRPKVLYDIVAEAIKNCIPDQELWDKTLAAEAVQREPLKKLHSRWDDVKAFIEYEDVDYLF